MSAVNSAPPGPADTPAAEHPSGSIQAAAYVTADPHIMIH